MSDHITVRPDQTAELIWRMQQAGVPWQVPLLPAGSRAPLTLPNPARQRKPLVVILGDDNGPSAGPDALPSARRLMRWARWILVHGAGGEEWHYAMAAEAALLFGRVLIVECDSAGLPSWTAMKLDLAPATPGVCFQVPKGRPAHPVHGARETVQ